MNPLTRAINIAGGQSALARSINAWHEKTGNKVKKIKQQHVWKWTKHSSGVPTAPPEHRLAIEVITNNQVTVRALSHDIYGLPEIAQQDESEAAA